MRNFFYITSRLSKIKISEQEKLEILHFFKEIKTDNTKQKEFYFYCKQYKLAPWMYVQMMSLDLLQYLEKEIVIDFDSMHKKAQTENENRLKTAKNFLSEFQKEGIDVAILKGNLLLHTAYKDSGYKKMNDFDILIKKENWDKAQDIYLKNEYIPLGFGWSGEKQKPAKFSHVGMSFLTPNFQCIIGTQWGLKSPTSSYKDNIEEGWESAKPFDLQGVSCMQLSPEYNLLHLILHLGIYKCGTRDLMDIYNLYISEKQNIDEDKLVEILKKANAIEKAYFAFKLANLASEAIPERLINRLKPQNGYILNRLNARLKSFEESGDIHHAYQDYFQDIEKEVIYFNLFSFFHKKLPFYLKIMRMILFPTCDMALKLSDKSFQPSFSDKLKSRVVAPFLVIQQIGQEIGIFVTLLLILKIFVDILISPIYYIFRKKSYFDYLKSIDIEPSTIEKMVKNIQ